MYDEYRLSYTVNQLWIVLAWKRGQNIHERLVHRDSMSKKSSLIEETYNIIINFFNIIINIINLLWRARHRDSCLKTIIMNAVLVVLVKLYGEYQMLQSGCRQVADAYSQLQANANGTSHFWLWRNALIFNHNIWKI